MLSNVSLQKMGSSSRRGGGGEQQLRLDNQPVEILSVGEGEQQVRCWMNDLKFLPGKRVYDSFNLPGFQFSSNYVGITIPGQILLYSV